MRTVKIQSHAFRASMLAKNYTALAQSFLMLQQYSGVSVNGWFALRILITSRFMLLRCLPLLILRVGLDIG